MTPSTSPFSVDTIIPRAVQELLGTARDVHRFSLTMQNTASTMAPPRFYCATGGKFVMECVFVAHARKPGRSFNIDTGGAGRTPKEAIVNLVRCLRDLHQSEATRWGRAAAQCASAANRETRMGHSLADTAAAERLDALATQIDAAWNGATSQPAAAEIAP